MDKNKAENDFFKTNELATYLNVSKKSIEKWRSQNRLPAVKVGYSWRYRKREIEKRLLSGQLLLPVDKG